MKKKSLWGKILTIYEAILILGWMASWITIIAGISMCICETAKAADVLLLGCIGFVVFFIGLAAFYEG